MQDAGCRIDNVEWRMNNKKISEYMGKTKIIPNSEQNDIIIYHSKDGKINVALMTKDGNVWLNQAQIATLFGTSIPNISIHIAKILKENELHPDSVIKYYLTTASDGKPYNVLYS